MITYTLKVCAIRKETEDAVTICFKQPTFRKVKYQAGQYLSLIFIINGRRYIRPYSFSSSPSVDLQLEVTVKRVKNGIVSNHIHDMVKTNDIVEVLEPMGDFVIPVDTQRINTIYLWGGGSGITPLHSLLREVLNTLPGIKINLIYSNQSSEATIFSKQLAFLEKEYLDRFRIWYFLSRNMLDSREENIISGRIDEGFVKDIVNSSMLGDALHYICGPAGLKGSVKDTLASLNLSESSIFTEDFELVKDPENFAEISTQIVNIQFNGNNNFIEVIKGKSVLESALDSGLDLPYSCQTGNCSTCKAKLLQGRLRMIGLSKDRSDLDTSEYLLCCSHPLSEGIIITI